MLTPDDYDDVIVRSVIPGRISKRHSVHSNHFDAPFRELHHYVLLFHDEMLEVPARGIGARLVTGEMRGILQELTSRLIEQP